MLGATHTLAPGPGAAAQREPELRLSGLPELRAPGRAGRGGELSRGCAASGCALCALREPPEQCEQDSKRARPWGVTSPLSLIRSAACAAPGGGATSAQTLTAPQAHTRMVAPWVPGSPCESSGPDPHTLLPGCPRPWASSSTLLLCLTTYCCSFKFLNTCPDSCVNFCKYILLHLFWGFLGSQKRKRSWGFGHINFKPLFSL